MRRIGIEWWNTHIYIGHSAMDMYVIERVLDGEWKRSHDIHAVWWKVFEANRDAKLYLRMLEPWRIAE